jgi:16S rRNA (guanine527-N7)-methyltransferase
VTVSLSSLPDVSRETRQRLDTIEAQLRKWQPRINLVAPSTMADIARRHIADSLQLVALAPGARSWIDLGSGGGFPGLVVAAALAEIGGSSVVLVESNAKKCAFLRETARLAALPVTVVCERIERVIPALTTSFDVVSARALASLTTLLGFAEPIVARGAVGVFPKGRDVDDEIRDALGAWNFAHDLIQSRTERDARIVRVLSIARRTP